MPPNKTSRKWKGIVTFQVKIMFRLGFTILNLAELFFYDRLIAILLMFFLQPFWIGSVITLTCLSVQLGLMLYHCLSDASPTLKQHCVDVSCFLELQLLFLFCNVAFKKYLLAQVSYLRTCALSYLRTCVLTHLRTCALLHTCASTCSISHLRTCTLACASNSALGQVITHLRTCARTCALSTWVVTHLRKYNYLRTCVLLNLCTCASTCALAYLNWILCT